MVPDIVRAFLIYLIVQGLKALGRILGYDLSGVAAGIAAAAVAAIVLFAEGLVSLLPPEWQQVAVAVLNLIAAILVAMGFHYELKKAFG